MKHQNLLTAMVVAALAVTASAQTTGPSSSASPYITPNTDWSVTSLLTTGDSVGGYLMAGIPDGLGAYDNGNGTITVLMNHELGNAVGTTRAHGSIGAFVSQYVINKNTLAVTSGQDLVQNGNNVFTWNGSAYVQGTTVFNRLCSADLAKPGAFYNTATSTGYNGRIFMNGEESGAQGRAFAFVATGASAGNVYQLPALGRFSWENSAANPFTGNTTAVIGQDDSTPGQVYLYQGTKTNTGNAVEQAGLTNGTLGGIRVTNGGANYSNGAVTRENAGAINGTFTVASVDADVSNTLGTAGTTLQNSSNTAGVTEFARPEDGAWLDADTYYFVTTGAAVDSVVQTSKLYRLDFSDSSLTGGTITMVLDRTQLSPTPPGGIAIFDNLTIGADGLIYIQEDPGNNNYIARIWQVDPNNPTAAVALFNSDATRFATGGANFLTIDEEHSGIVEVTDLFTDASWYQAGQKVFLGDTQNHAAATGPNAATLVEGGQIQLIVSSVPEPSTNAMLVMGVIALFVAAQRRQRQA